MFEECHHDCNRKPWSQRHGWTCIPTEKKAADFKPAFVDVERGFKVMLCCAIRFLSPDFFTSLYAWILYIILSFENGFAAPYIPPVSLLIYLYALWRVLIFKITAIGGLFAACVLLVCSPYAYLRLQLNCQAKLHPHFKLKYL